MKKAISSAITILMIGTFFSSGIGFDILRQGGNSSFSGENSTVNLSNWAIIPAYGPIDGGTNFTITGSNFSSLLEPRMEINNTIVDSAVGGYPSSLVVDSSGDVHISYGKKPTSGYTDLKYAIYDGSSWTTSTVASDYVGQYNSLAVESNGDLHISYWSELGLKYTTYDGISWSNTTVDSAEGVGCWNSLAVDSSGDVHISYYDPVNNSLKYATYDGISWSKTFVDGYDQNNPHESVGSYNSLAVDSNNKVHISYRDEDNNNLKYATFDGISWNISTVNGNPNYDLGMMTSLAVDSSGDVHISYWDSDLGLKYAIYDGISWETTIVDNIGNVGGRGTSISVESNGDVHISYWDGNNGALKYATFDGSSWTNITVDATWGSSVGSYSSLAVDSNGDVHISHWDITNDGLKYAKLSGSTSNEITIQFGDYGNVTGTVVDDSTINVTSPQGPSSGEVVDITLWDWNGTGYVLNSAFTYFNPDIDGDGVQNTLDDCPEIIGNSTIDQIGCPDSDGDGYSDSGDAFPTNSGEWSDGDGDGVGDNGDAFPSDANEFADSDGDGVGDNSDAFPTNSGEWSDEDGDGVGDNGDAFPSDANESADSDGDGVGDNGDAFPEDSNESADNDGDGIGDNGDHDDDNDLLSDEFELSIGTNPMNPDTDGDGVADGLDECANSVGVVQQNGCAPPSEKEGMGATEIMAVTGGGVGLGSLLLFFAWPRLFGRSKEKDEVIQQFSLGSQPESTGPPKIKQYDLSPPPILAKGIPKGDGYEWYEWPEASGDWWYRMEQTQNQWQHWKQ